MAIFDSLCGGIDFHRAVVESIRFRTGALKVFDGDDDCRLYLRRLPGAGADVYFAVNYFPPASQSRFQCTKDSLDARIQVFDEGIADQSQRAKVAR